MLYTCHGPWYVPLLRPFAGPLAEQRQDYPYGIGFWDVEENIRGLSDADFLSSDEKEDVFHRNAKSLWEGKTPRL